MRPDAPPPVPGRFLLTAFGLGRLPVAPGTWTSVATAVAIGAAERGAGLGLAAAGALFAFGALTTLAYGRVEDAEGRPLDPSWIVTDEVAGQAAATAGALLHHPSVASVAVSFFAFRLLDVLKPGPVDRLQRLPGGQGVLLDDVVAGLAAGAIAFGASHALDVLR